MSPAFLRHVVADWLSHDDQTPTVESSSMQFQPKRCEPLARELQGLLRDSDFAVLHLQTKDITPFLALAGQEEGPPAMLVNHADHAFASWAPTPRALAPASRATSPGLLPIPWSWRSWSTSPFTTTPARPVAQTP